MINNNQLDTFVTALGEKRVRYELSPHLWDAFTRAFPHETTAGMSRQILHEVISQLCGRGFTVPKQKKSFNRDGFPLLPNWIKRPTNVDKDRFTPEKHLWARELTFLAAASHLPSFKLWLKLDEWLKGHRHKDLPMLPIKERSLEIFGEEKALDALSKNRHFKEGVITLETLRCFPVYEMLAYDAGPANTHGKPCLVIENPTTVWTLSKWNKTAEKYSCIVYGGGNRISKTWEGLIPLQKKFGFKKAMYFGDIDVPGFDMAFRAMAGLAEQDLFPLELDESLYTLTLKLAEDVELNIEPNKKRLSQKVSNWIPPSIAKKVQRSLERHSRIPQEIVTITALDMSLPEH